MKREDLDKLKDNVANLWEQGHNLHEIMDITGIKKIQTVQYYLKARGIDYSKRKEPSKGERTTIEIIKLLQTQGINRGDTVYAETILGIAETLCIQPDTVKRKLRENGYKPTETKKLQVDLESRIWKMNQEGLPNRDIAKEVGIKTGQVSYRLTRKRKKERKEKQTQTERNFKRIKKILEEITGTIDKEQTIEAKTVLQIAERIGLKFERVRRILLSNGYKTRGINPNKRRKRMTPAERQKAISELIESNPNMKFYADYPTAELICKEIDPDVSPKTIIIDLKKLGVGKRPKKEKPKPTKKEDQKTKEEKETLKRATKKLILLKATTNSNYSISLIITKEEMQSLIEELNKEMEEIGEVNTDQEKVELLQQKMMSEASNMLSSIRENPKDSLTNSDSKMPNFMKTIVQSAIRYRRYLKTLPQQLDGLKEGYILLATQILVTFPELANLDTVKNVCRSTTHFKNDKFTRTIVTTLLKGLNIPENEEIMQYIRRQYPGPDNRNIEDI